MNYTLLFIQMSFCFVFVTVTAEALQLEATLTEKEGACLKPNTEGFAFIQHCTEPHKYNDHYCT